MLWHAVRIVPIPLAAVAILGLAWDDAAHAAEQPVASELVSEALHREVYGLQADRTRLLATAVSADPNYAPARWHQGFVRLGRQWSHFYDVPEILGTNPRLTAYKRLRDEQPDSVEGHLRLANWCRDHNLLPQQRAHLTRVLDFDPSHAEARGRLGFRLVSGAWVHEDDVAMAAQRQATTRTAMEKWQPEFVALRRKLGHANLDKRQSAIERLRAITAPDAIPALEEVLASHSERTAKLVVDVLSQMPDEAAILALVRLAILSPWPEVRDEATLQLRTRPREAYIPVLLASMYTPVVTRTAIAPVDGRLVYAHSFVREGQEQRDVLLLNSEYRRQALPGGDGRETLWRAFMDSARTAATYEQAVQRQNEWTLLLNQRITTVLNLATQQQLPATPEPWWEWWNDQNDVVMQGEKQTRTEQRTRQVSLVDQTSAQFGSNGGAQGSVSPRQRQSECFAAGTPVWTQSGMMTIESIRVGDLVLSQHVETGELAYQPVLRTTVRPRERLNKLRVGIDTFETSNGHLFWVSGRGWTMARELHSGMFLHAVDGTVPVVSVAAGQEAETYNLVVADFNTYIVGDGKILSHDVTNRRSQRFVVPGLAGE